MSRTEPVQVYYCLSILLNCSLSGHMIVPSHIELFTLIF